MARLRPFSIENASVAFDPNESNDLALLYEARTNHATPTSSNYAKLVCVCVRVRGWPRWKATELE